MLLAKKIPTSKMKALVYSLILECLIKYYLVKGKHSGVKNVQQVWDECSGSLENLPLGYIDSLEGLPVTTLSSIIL